jgi:hypothetical protein
MDLSKYLPDYKVLMWRFCKYAIPPKWLQSHLQRRHKEDYDDLRSQSGPASMAKKLLSRHDMPVLDPRWEVVTSPTSDSEPIPVLESTAGEC